MDINQTKKLLNVISDYKNGEINLNNATFAVSEISQLSFEIAESLLKHTMRNNVKVLKEKSKK